MTRNYKSPQFVILREANFLKRFLQIITKQRELQIIGNNVSRRGGERSVSKQDRVERNARLRSRQAEQRTIYYTRRS